MMALGLGLSLPFINYTAASLGSPTAANFSINSNSALLVVLLDDGI